MRIRIIIGLIILFLASSQGAPVIRADGLADANAKLKVYQTPYYVIHTDLDVEQVREAAIRMTKMFEEYKTRTAGFSGAITEKFPFYLFSKAEDYYAAGGIPRSAGAFMVDQQGSRLMAIAGHEDVAYFWHTVQHEGFHQFAHNVIRGKLPTWLDEGLAEYFGEAVFTGDNFVAGVIPPERLDLLREEFQKHSLKTMLAIMTTSPEQWQKDMSSENYDQAWSMVHFLAHGDNGKYQAAMGQFILALGRGVSYEVAWNNIFGNIPTFEKKWQAWWQALPADPTAILYQKATVLTLTSFMGRAISAGQSFKTADDFFAAVQQKAAPSDFTLPTVDLDGLKCPREDWLPPSLLRQALKHTDVGTWTIVRQNAGLPRLVLTTPDNTVLTGSFTFSSGHVRNVTCDVKPPKPVPATRRSVSPH